MFTGGSGKDIFSCGSGQDRVLDYNKTEGDKVITCESIGSQPPPPQENTGTLFVTKHVINDNGGTKQAKDFTIHISAQNASDNADIAGDESGTKIVLHEGTFDVYEDDSALDSYFLTRSGECSGFIQAGETKNCLMANDDIGQATLIVKKHVINDNGGTKEAKDFTMGVGGASDLHPTPSSFPGSESGTNVTIKERSFYQVFEDAGQQDQFYIMQQSGDCFGEMVPGEVWTCTVTNDDVPAGTLIVKKHVINDNGGTKEANDFRIFVTTPTGRVLPNDFDGSESGTQVKLEAGSYNVTEQVRPGTYNVQRTDGCEGVIEAGQTKTCTITNNDTGNKMTMADRGKLATFLSSSQERM